MHAILENNVHHTPMVFSQHACVLQLSRVCLISARRLCFPFGNTNIITFFFFMKPVCRRNIHGIWNMEHEANHVRNAFFTAVVRDASTYAWYTFVLYSFRSCQPTQAPTRDPPHRWSSSQIVHDLLFFDLGPVCEHIAPRESSHTLPTVRHDYAGSEPSVIVCVLWMSDQFVAKNPICRVVTAAAVCGFVRYPIASTSTLTRHFLFIMVIWNIIRATLL